MSLPATPAKRILTEDDHSARSASYSPNPDIVSDDLRLRLQNLGSRVRKNVNNGYATERYGNVPSVTPTPFSSPVKPSAASAPSQTPDIFRSAKDTLHDVFSSPTRPTELVHSPSPSPRKRGHAEADSQDEEEGCPPVNPSDGYVTAMQKEAASDGEDVVIITDASASQTPSRPIKPLKRITKPHISPQFSGNAFHSSSSSFDPSGADACPGGAGSAEWKNLFNQPL